MAQRNGYNAYIMLVFLRERTTPRVLLDDIILPYDCWEECHDSENDVQSQSPVLNGKRLLSKRYMQGK